MARRSIWVGMILSVSLLLGVGGARAADEIDAGDRAAIRAVIEGQLAAFQRDDGDTAFAAAAPVIKDIFHDPNTFMSMVRGGYPAVYRPRSVEFGETATLGGQLVQIVHVVDPQGRPMMAIYTMERQPDGAWKISGCRIVPEKGVVS